MIIKIFEAIQAANIPCSSYMNVSKERRMLQIALMNYKQAKRDRRVVNKTGFGDFNAAILIESNAWNIFENMRRLYYLGYLIE